MNVAAGKSPTSGGVAGRLAFFKGLQTVTTRIHATQNVDEIIFELSADLCELFGAERLTIYTVDETRSVIQSKVKTGLHSVNSIRLPISESSIAGFVALTKRILNIADVYDKAELQAISPQLELRKEVDEVTHFRSKQMLAAPILSDKGELEGVLQLINSVDGKPFSPIAEEGLLGLAQTLGVAFAQRTRAPGAPRSRYDLLVTEAKITADELDAATRKAREKKVPTEEVLVEDMGLTLQEVGEAVAGFFQVPYEPYRSDRIKPVDLLKNIKREFVEQSHWLPLEENEQGIVVMAMDPEQVRASRQANNVFPNKKIVIRATTGREFRKTVDQYFEASLDLGSVDDLLSDLVEEDPESSMAEELSAAADNELVKLVNKVIVDAYKQGASDIHIEPRPGKEKTMIRFRKDGSLVPYIEVPASYRNPLVTRIKIMCDLDISERRKPQDGKIKFRKFSPLDIELRVATLPTAGGIEDVVMRILANSEPIPLDKLGLSENNLTRLKDTIAKPYGIFFVCGPTGSGKTTTLHSILGHINTPDTKIWTAEDPVEITQKGLRQCQVNRKAGMDFATMMRAFLRADPDVIMVGEMRDQETVSVGIEASLTGHLVFSTLHTNSAPESVVRLLDMGMDPFNFADALLGVLAQRLAKRLCTKCRQAYHPDGDELSALLDEYCADLHLTTPFKADAEAARKAIARQWQSSFADKNGQFTLYKAVGCDDCTNGYRGRLGLHELMLGSDNSKKLIQDRAHVAELLALALEEGMRTLRQDGIEKVLAGLTDMVQVRKVCVR
jgi:type II secretory ATPase GspE/PulE/Tfp pilus assembly ATPase PilB-like protein